jgi:valyl-tRNA synthetase
MRNIQPWCISRQLWWGHQIPAWYDAEGRCFVAHDVEEAARQAGVPAAELTQDPDVLDTWFSSALWPFSTLGWPERTADLDTFYPTDVLVTGHDILFFWVARMVMVGLHFTGEVPFHTVHLTGLVRDAEGVKMSKTKGNVLDPADLVAEYGADALRFTLAILDAPGRDIPLDPERMAGYRAFGNKIWNATRFALSRVGEGDRVAADLGALNGGSPAGLAAPERWILSRLSATAAEVGDRFETYRFDEACNRLYHFFWGELCDWYIELAKPALTGEAPRPRVGEVLLTVLDRSLRLLHPVMPHLTEELWQRLPGHQAIHAETIALAPYPGREEGWEDPGLEERMEALFAVVQWVRGVRADLGLDPKERLKLRLVSEDSATAALIHESRDLIDRLSASRPALDIPETASCVSGQVAGVAVTLFTGELSPEIIERLKKELGGIEHQLAGVEKRLANEQFLSKAAPEVVEGARRQREELHRRREVLMGCLRPGPPAMEREAAP